MTKRKKPILHCDAHVLQRAVMTDSEFKEINKSLKDSINAMRAHCAPKDGAAATGAHCPPHSNTGGKNKDVIHLVLDNGKIKEVLPRKHYESKVAFIDWLNITCHESSFEILDGCVTDGEIVLSASRVAESIFGFGITAKLERGRNFYHTAYTLGDGYGLVCYGGQRNTVLFMLNGEGCAAARHGWERRMFDFLRSCQNGKITRIDLSHDDIEGTYFNMEMLEEAYDNDLFNAGGNNPDIEMRGNWKNPNGKGRTINVGHRTNGKFFRGYEKGKQLGSSVSNWVRCEVEFKSVDRVIPFECLLYPHEYFAASYPIFANLSQVTERILTTQKTVELSYERTKAWLKKQCGSALNLVNEMEGFDGIEQLFRDGKLPSGVIFPSFLESPDAMHHYQQAHGLPCQSPLLQELN